MRRLDFLADMHLTNPTKAMLLARALGILPKRALIVGCIPEDCQEPVMELSVPVARAIPEALALTESTVRAWTDE